MDAILIEALKGALTSSPFLAFVIFLWWQERQERREKDKAFLDLLIKSIEADNTASVAMERMTESFKIGSRLIKGGD